MIMRKGLHTFGTYHNNTILGVVTNGKNGNNSLLITLLMYQDNRQHESNFAIKGSELFMVFLCVICCKQ